MTVSTETLHIDLIISRENYDCSETLNKFSQYFTSLNVNYTYKCYIYILSRFSNIQLCVTLQTRAHQAPLSMGFPGKNTGVGCHGLLQGISPTQGLNLSLLHWGRFFTIWATWQPQIYLSSLALLLEIPLESVFHKGNRLVYYNRQVL